MKGSSKRRTWMAEAARRAWVERQVLPVGFVGFEPEGKGQDATINGLVREAASMRESIGEVRKVIKDGKHGQGFGKDLVGNGHSDTANATSKEAGKGRQAVEAQGEEMKGRIGCLMERVVGGQREIRDSIKLEEMAEKRSEPQQRDELLPDAPTELATGTDSGRSATTY